MGLACVGYAGEDGTFGNRFDDDLLAALRTLALVMAEPRPGAADR